MELCLNNVSVSGAVDGFRTCGFMKQAVAAVHRCVLSQPQEYTDKQFAKIFEDILQVDR